MRRAPRAAARCGVVPRFASVRALRLESLEGRRLLAADLLAAADPAHATGAGDKQATAPSPSHLGSAARDLEIVARPFAEKYIAPGAVAPLASASPVGLTPSQIRHAYGFDRVEFVGSIAGDGAGQTIAIVDAYHTPAAYSDLLAFSSQFGIAAPPSFTQVAQDGTTNFPAVDASGDWALETALDVQWAHALAPKANILLVEARSSLMSDLVAAVDYARNQPGVSVVSMSWGAGEFAGESIYDGYFTTPAGHSGVTFLAATGDTGTPGGYPAYSPNVVAVGGTTLHIDNSQPAPDYVFETGWTGSGGGVSEYAPQPDYQKSVVPPLVTTSHRTIPDVAFNADPVTGVAVYSSQTAGASTPWVRVGGTSFASPAWAALLAIANQGRALRGLTAMDGPTKALPLLYGLPQRAFHDVTLGSNGLAAGDGYDLVTGRGSAGAQVIAAALSEPSVSGSVYLDSNNNHVLDPLEPGLAGWTVFDDLNANGTFDQDAPLAAAASDLPKPIVDLGVVASSLEIAGLADTISDLDVTVTLHHATTADLALTLVSPEGIAVPLVTKSGAAGDHFLGTTFDDEASTSIVSAAAPFAGSFRPVNALAAFDGTIANGTWKLVIADSAAGTAGTLDAWSLVITTSPDLVSATSDAGDYHFMSLPLGVNRFREIASPSYALTTPASGVYALNVTASTNLTTLHFGNAGSTLAGRVYDDVNGNGQLDNDESGVAGWTVYDDANNDGVRDVATQATLGSVDVPKSILDLDTTTSALAVSGQASPIADLNVRLSLHHTYDADLVISLTSPVGTERTLAYRAGSFGHDFLGTVFDDESDTPIDSGSAPFSGNYRPEEPLAAFDGEDPNGLWVLSISDVAGVDVGMLDSWSLEFTSGTSERTTISAADGTYQFADLGPGAHHIRQVAEPGYAQTAPAGGAYHETITSYASLTGRDFGNTTGAAVVGRWLFYQGSPAWQTTSGNPPGNSDDHAIAPDKTAYLANGSAATFANVSSYTRGINGLMIDLAGTSGPISADDFEFRMGNNTSPQSWVLAPSPSGVTTRAGDGVGGADRIVLLWPDGAIQRTWLRVVVRGNDALGGFNGDTGLATSDVFYFGSAVADSGYGDANTFAVTTADEQAARNDPRGPGNPAAITNTQDYNRDGLVNAADEQAVRNYRSNPVTALIRLSLGGGQVTSLAMPSEHLQTGAVGSRSWTVVSETRGAVDHGSTVGVTQLLPLARGAGPALRAPSLRDDGHVEPVEFVGLLIHRSHGGDETSPLSTGLTTWDDSLLHLLARDRARRLGRIAVKASA